MTIPATERQSQLYVGNGSNVRFDFKFRVFDQEDESGIIVRKKVGVEWQTIGPSEYVLVLNENNEGGHIDFITPPSTETYFYIYGDTPNDQMLDLTNYDNFYPDALERALDKLTAILIEWRQLLSSEVQSRILADIDYDQLAQQREADLKAYIDGIASAVVGNPVTGLPAQFVVDGEKTQKEINGFTGKQKSIWFFMTPSELISESTNPSGFDWAPIAQRAADSDYPAIHVPAKNEPYYTNWTIFVRKDKKFVGDGAEVSKFKLFDQCAIYHNPNRSDSTTDKGLGDNLYDDYHAVMTVFANNFNLEGIGLDANVMGNFVNVGGTVYHYASATNGAGVTKFCNVLVIESTDGGTLTDKWRIFNSKIEASSRVGLLLNQTASVVFKGRFEFESSHIKSTHEDALSYHKIANFKVWNSSFGNSHSHLNHFYYKVSGGEVHNNYYYLDDSYQNILPQYTTEKLAFIFGHNTYDLNTCENVRVFDNLIENKWTKGEEIANMRLCAASIARTPKNVAFNNNTGRKLYYGIAFSGLPLGINKIIGNNFEYELRGVSFSLNGAINSLENIPAPVDSYILFGGNVFKYSGTTVGIGIYHDVRVTGGISPTDAAKLNSISILDLGNTYDLGHYLNDMTGKINYVQNSICLKNIISRLNSTELLSAKQFQWFGRGNTNANTTYTIVDSIFPTKESLKGAIVNSTYSGDTPNISGDSESFSTAGGFHNISFYAKNLNESNVFMRVEQRNPATNTLIKVLVSDVNIGLNADMKQINRRFILDAAQNCIIRVVFYGVTGSALNFERYGLQVNSGTCRTLTEDQSYKYIESSSAPTDTTKMVGTQVMHTNPTTHIGWVCTATGWKTFGAIT